jgi:glycosyltransferase involved in cell wall biosynthesis
MFVEEEINGCDHSRFGRSIYHQWERRALDAADGIIVTSRLLERRMPSDVPISIIAYPIANVPTLDRNVTRGETILFVGSIQPRKGVETWVRSLNSVMDALPQVSAAMVGPDTRTGPDESSMVDHLMTLLDARHAGRLQWLGSHGHDQVMSMIASASLVVVPSVFESFSFAAAEALGCGTPVLVSDQVGIGEHVQGLPSCPAGGVSSWAEAQIRILSKPIEALRNAQEQAKRLFETCAPARHLKLREEFIRSVQAALPARARSKGSPDSLVEMQSFVREVDELERSIGIASRV